MAHPAAHAAWQRVVEQSHMELARRTPVPPGYRDPLADAWLADGKAQFLSAWSHVASMAGGLRDEYAAHLTSPHRDHVRRAIEALRIDVAGVLRVLRSDEGARTFKPAISAIEGVLVACLGHSLPRMRAHAVKMLNALYDGVDWQLNAPLPPVMAQVDDASGLDVYTACMLGDAGGGGCGHEQFRVLLSAPSFDRAHAGQGVDHIITMHAPNAEQEEVWARVPVAAAGPAQSGGAVPPAAATAAGSSLESLALATADAPDGSCRYVKLRAWRVRQSLSHFTRCGFYDWRLVAVSAAGVTRPVAQLAPVLGHDLDHLINQGVLPAPGEGHMLSPTLPASLGSAQVTGLAAGINGAGSSGSSSSSSGAGVHSQYVPPAGSAAASAAAAFAESALPLTLAQGRWIVHRRGITTESMHETVVDMEGMRLSESGEITRHGTFADVAGSLSGLRDAGVTSLFVRGAIERDNGWGEREPDARELAEAAVAPTGGSSGAATPAPQPDSARVLLTADGGGGALGLGRRSRHAAAAAVGVRRSSGSESIVTDQDFGMFLDEAPELQSSAAAPYATSAAARALMGALPLQQLVVDEAAGAALGGGASPPSDNAAAPTSSGGSDAVATAGVRAFALRPDASLHAVVDRHTPNRMAGGVQGMAQLCSEARELGMRVLVQLDASISASRPHRKYRYLTARTLDTKGQAVTHHGTDCLENQWEDTQLLNYRKVEAWDLLVSEAKTLLQNFKIGGLCLSEAQGYPFIMALDTSELLRRDVDGEHYYSRREVLEGEVVIANTEAGFWTTKAARNYANPLLVKLTRALWAIDPDFVVIGDSHWGRGGALQRSGVIPRSLDVVSAMAATIGRFVDKNGTITPVSLPGHVQPVHLLRALITGEAAGAVPPQMAPNFVHTHLASGRGFPSPLDSSVESPGGPMPIGGGPLQLRSLSSARLPYPALLLGRSAWTGVDLLYTLPGVPTTFGEERQGRAYRVDVAGTYTYNPSYLEEEKKKREKRLAAEKAAARATGMANSASASRGGGSARGSMQQPPYGMMPGGSPGRPLGSSSRVSSQGQLDALGGGSSQHVQPPHHHPLHHSGSSSAFDVEGDVGVGGVIPAMPIRGAPSYKIARTGFSHMNLASLVEDAPPPSSHEPTSPSQLPGDAINRGVSPRTQWGLLQLQAGAPPLAAGTTGAVAYASGVRVAGSSSSSGSSGSGSSESRTGAPTMMRAGSSPALASLLPAAGYEPGGEPSSAADYALRGRHSRNEPHEDEGDGSQAADDDAEEDEDEEEGEHAEELATASLAAMSLQDSRQLEAPSNYGFHVPALSGAGGGRPPRAGGSGSARSMILPAPLVGGSASSKLRESWGASDVLSVRSTGEGGHEHHQLLLASATTTVTAVEAGSVTSAAGGSFRLRSPSGSQRGGRSRLPPRPASAAGSATLGEALTRVTSWAALDSMTFKGGDGMGLGAGGASLRESLKQMVASEARLRSDVGPQYGFDLGQIAGHYDHRRLLRARYPVLREGGLIVLQAEHRYGEHGHVFSFARTLPGQVAVVASNFNGHPSTFTVDCGPLVPALGAATTSDASESVAQLMNASVALGEAVKARAASSAPAASAGDSHALPAEFARLSLRVPLPTLNLKGGVWEVRDVFASDGRRAATAGVFTGASSFSESDGPLIGIMTSEEAAYAPMLMQLQPHRSYCWLYVAATGATGSIVRTPVAGTGPTAAASGGGFQVLHRGQETDAAAMQWLFASSLLRLQSVMRLKEVGLASAIITRAEVDAAGGSLERVLAARKLGAGEPWISPGEALKDAEIQQAARHNLVYALLRNVVKRCTKAVGSARRGGAGAAAPIGWGVVSHPEAARSAPAATRDALAAVIGETAVHLEAALRVLVTHWRLRPTPKLPGRSEPPSLVSSPLPSLHGAMNRMEMGASYHQHSSTGAGTEAAWVAVDGEAAVAIARTALFLAVKDVVGQASGKQAAAAAATGAAPEPASAAAAAGAAAGSGARNGARGGGGDADVSDEDATVSALLIKGLVRIARGRTASGAVIRAAEAPGSAAAATPDDEAVVGVERGVVAFAHRLLWRNQAAPIVFVTPELGKWSTVGGLGVMVDELSVGLAELGLNVVCVSPYYNVDRKGRADYLRADGIAYTGRNVTVWVGPERIDMGVHEGRVKGVRLLFLHNGEVFPRPYPPHDAYHQVRVLAAFAKGTLQLLCDWRLIPQVVVTNDWFTGLVPAYARHGHFGDAFQRTDFMHIAHNLDPDYEGRLWPQPGQGSLAHLHSLPQHLLVDPHWHDVVVNPTRAALMCSDTWATVSRSYRADLLKSSPLRSLLELAPHPFAHPNGIPVRARLARLASLPFPTHEAAKAALQRKYFGFGAGDPAIPLFAFVGRITLQKGVHLILQAVDELLRATGDRAQFLVGGMASTSDTYGAGCAHVMRDLKAKHPSRFWADPGLFFTDGDLVNLGADFCMMPSMFEPGGIVQQEFFVAGTPVIAFKTGGLKDTVHEWDPARRSGNGLTFEAHNVGDFSAAVHRAIVLYNNAGDYAALRANARASVMDLAVVSQGWFREFHRLRRCLPPAPQPLPSEVAVAFAIKVGEVPGLTGESAVEITGSFAGWARKHPLTLAPGGGCFEAALSLLPGTYQFKFVVDGTWTTAPSVQVADDGTGNMNNIIVVQGEADQEGDF